MYQLQVCLYLQFLLSTFVPRIFILAQSIGPGDPSNRFNYPHTQGAADDYSANEIWSIGSVKNIQWTSNWTTGVLLLFQNNNSNYDLLYTWTSPTNNYDWVVNIGNNDQSLDPVYFLFMAGSPSSIPSFESHYFNLTGSAIIGSPPTTSSVVSSTLSSTSSLAASSTTTSQGPTSESSTMVTSTHPVYFATSSISATSSLSSSTSITVPQSTGSLAVPSSSEGRYTEIGVGAGVGGAALVTILIAAFCIGQRSRRRTEDSMRGSFKPTTGTYPPDDEISPYSKLECRQEKSSPLYQNEDCNSIHELSNAVEERPPAEMWA